MNRGGLGGHGPHSQQFVCHPLKGTFYFFLEVVDGHPQTDPLCGLQYTWGAPGGRATLGGVHTDRERSTWRVGPGEGLCSVCLKAGRPGRTQDGGEEGAKRSVGGWLVWRGEWAGPEGETWTTRSEAERMRNKSGCRR